MKTLAPIKRKAVGDNLPQAIHASEVLNSKFHKAEVFQSLLDLKRDKDNLDSERRPLFFWLGMSLSLLMVIIAFNWKTYDDTGLLDLGDIGNDFDEIMEVPVSLQPPPPPPQKMEVFVVKEVANDEVIEEVKMDLDIELTEDMKIQDVVFEEAVVEEEEEKADEIFQIVEDQPTFPGGIKAFYEYVGENVHYPSVATRLGVTGRVYVRFVIEKDGHLTDIKVVKGIGSGCDEEAIRVLENSPAWIPGKQRGNKVRVSMTVPIHFLLRE